MAKFEAGKVYQIDISATTSGNRDDAQTIIGTPRFPDVSHGHEWTIDTTQPYSFTVSIQPPAEMWYWFTVKHMRRLRRERRSVTKR